jgi:hypothetical protein
VFGVIVDAGGGVGAGEELLPDLALEGVRGAERLQRRDLSDADDLSVGLADLDVDDVEDPLGAVRTPSNFFADAHRAGLLGGVRRA